ncbi:MAG TPA: hypothetical protein VMV46_05735, partial [Thermoanaerobaculia bacterium]|nr:hypothetical protein [Thermoanaerobaculia bacterium]
PATDITVLVVDPARDPPAIGEATRVTDRERYDNQPAFLADGSLLYTAAGDDGATDILRWDPATGDVAQVVATPQSEYSPTAIPGRDAISVVRDYGNQDQQLWSFPLRPGLPGGGEPRLLLPDVNPVGYHAWIDAERLLLFVLGEPPTLRLARVGPGPGEVLATHPGRALARLPGGPEVLFVQKVSEQDWWLTAIDVDARTRRRLARMAPPHEDYAAAPDGALWTGRGSRLLRFMPGRDADWVAVADLAAYGIVGITRLAFDADGTRLAVVHEHRSPR